MKLPNFLLGLAAVVLALTAAPGMAQTQTVPQVQKVNPGDLFQDIVNGSPQSGNVYASTLQIGGALLGQATKLNLLIGGDAQQNLFQRGTTGASVTTTITYGGPDRWAYWSGANTAMTVSKDTTAADLPTQAYAAGFKMARTSGQTGVVQMCMTQEVESQNAIMFQGSTAELDFYATAGSNFSSASNALTAYIITGTGTDEGVSKMAFAFNAGGGGSSTWAGQATTVADVATISTVPTRFAAVGVIPATTTEMAVVLCYTPVGTAGTNDYVALSGIQLTRNASLTSVAPLTTATDCSTINCSSFDRRPVGLETLLQQRYYYEIDETSAISIIAPCAAVDTTHTNCIIQTPATMRIAPTATFANGFATPTTTTQATLGACTTLSAATTVASTVGSPNQFLVNCAATTVPAAGVASFLYSNGGTGKIRLTSEL